MYAITPSQNLPIPTVSCKSEDLTRDRIRAEKVEIPRLDDHADASRAANAWYTCMIQYPLIFPIKLFFFTSSSSSVRLHVHPCLQKTSALPWPPCSLLLLDRHENSPLLVLRILATNDIHVSSLLPPHALAPVAQLLDRAPHLHATRLLRSSLYP